MKIKDIRNVHIKYEPQKLHIRAVSVGSVTTGGAYTTGGYNYKNTGFTGNLNQPKTTFAQCEQIVAWMCGDCV